MCSHIQGILAGIHAASRDGANAGRCVIRRAVCWSATVCMAGCDGQSRQVHVIRRQQLLVHQVVML